MRASLATYLKLVSPPTFVYPCFVLLLSIIPALDYYTLSKTLYILCLSVSLPPQNATSIRTGILVCLVHCCISIA